MNPTDKMQLKAQLSTISAQNMAVRSMFAIPPNPVLGGMPPVPIVLAPAFSSWSQAFMMQAENTEKLIKVLEDFIAKS